MTGIVAMSGSTITTVEALEATIGKTPPPMHLKVIDLSRRRRSVQDQRSLLTSAGFGDVSRVGVR
jgi:hypothetical protein